MKDSDLRSLWEQRLAEYEISGKSIKAWCQEQTIKENQFYYWRRKLRLNQAENKQPVKWLPLEVEQANLTADSIAVHVGQVTVEVKSGFNQHLFREIIQVLQTI